jgi:hypothetical protein
VRSKAAIAFYGEKLRPTADAVVELERDYLLYTNDAGGHWRRFALPAQAIDCQALDGDLLCSVSKRDEFLLLKIHPQPVER